MDMLRVLEIFLVESSHIAQLLGYCCGQYSNTLIVKGNAMVLSSFGESAGATRRTLLTRLQVEVHRLGGRALIVFSETDHPVLYVVRDGRRVAVLAVEHGGTWWFVWGKRDQIAADQPGLAARFLGGVHARVIDLFTRRPRVRGVLAGVA